MGSTPLLQSIQILITGVPDAEKAELRKAAGAQGAVIVSNPNANDPPHVILVRMAGTPRYLSVLRRSPRIPVVTPEWLTASLAAGARQPYAAHAAGALQGIKVCFSGLPVPEKKELSAAVLAAGAEHSTSLDRSCTHLVADTTQSDKYVFARHHKIHCVSPAWVRDSLDAGRCLDPEKYPVGGPAATTAPTVSLAGAGASSQQHGSGLARQTSLVRVQAEAEAQRSGGEGDVAAAETAPLADVLGPGPAPEPWALLDCDDNAPNYLGNCFLWVVGCTPAEEVESMKLAAQGGAKRFSGDAGPHPTLTTHVVLGSARVGSAEAESAAVLVSERRDVAVVTLEWLRCSVAREQAMPADERFKTALPAAPRNATAIPATLQPGGGSGALDDRSLASLPAGGADDVGGASLLRQASLAAAGAGAGGGSGPGVPGFLDGCYFTLAAVRGAPEGAAAERLIRCHGGRLFSASLPPGGRAVHAICPYSLTPAAAAALRTAAPDFAAVPESARFTLYWLECCCEAGCLIDPSPGAPCYQPLPYPLPLQGMERVSVAISGYDHVSRAAIQRHVEIAGGHVSVEYMTSRQSHLIVPNAAGKKYMYTSQYGVVPVTADWLLTTLRTGKLQPEGPYAPLLPSGAPAPPQKGSESAGMERATSSPAPRTQKHKGAALPGPSSLHAAAMAGPSAAGPAAGRKGSGGVPKPALPTAPAAPSSQARGPGVSSGVTGSAAANPASTASGATGPPRRGKLKAHIAELNAKKAAMAAKPAPAARPAFDFDSLFSEDAGNSGIDGGAGRAAAAGAATAAIASVLGRNGGGGGSQTLMPPPAPVTRAPVAAAALPGGSPTSAAAQAIPGRSARASPPPPAVATPASETQDDGGALDAALASLKDQLGRIGQRASAGGTGGGKGSNTAATATAAALAAGSQIDMMPPPPVRAAGRERKGRAEKRTRGVAGGSEGSDGVSGGGGGAAQRRSKRRGVTAVLESESEAMAASQQVGYEAVAVDVDAMAAAAAGCDGGGARAAKERLTRAAAKQRRGLAAHSADALDAIS